MKKEENLMEKISSLCKVRGFIYQGSEIYGGLAGTWDYGPLGVELKNNIKNLWWKRFVQDRDDVYGVDAAILMNQKVWEASGHTGAGFADPLVEDLKTRKRYRADHLLEDQGIDPLGMTLSQMSQTIKDKKVKSPDGNELSGVQTFNMMFKTFVGPASHEDVDGSKDKERKLLEYDPMAVSYLRPETAQGIFVNFKNVVDSFRPKMPFGIGQIGKAFRNEIAPRDYIFRSREFEQMEIEYFVNEAEWEKHFEHWLEEMKRWMVDIGLPKESVHELDVPEEDRAHYSKKTIDFEFDYPFGTKELYGIAYRTDFDLSNHAANSKVDLSYSDDQSTPRSIPHVIEPTFGVDRTVLAVLTSAYTEDELGDSKRVFLRLNPKIAPVKVAVFPLLKNKPELVERARSVYMDIKREIPQVMFDTNGNIGKRYRRQDEIGTPLCVTIDFETLDDDTVTLRDRDTGEQERVPYKELLGQIHSTLEG